MNKVQFRIILENIKAHSKSISRDEIGVFSTAVIEICDPLFSVISSLFESIFTEEGAEWIEWFLWEKGYCYDRHLNEDCLKSYDNDGNEIIKDVSELYDFLETHYLKHSE